MTDEELKELEALHALYRRRICGPDNDTPQERELWDKYGNIDIFLILLTEVKDLKQKLALCSATVDEQQKEKLKKKFNEKRHH